MKKVFNPPKMGGGLFWPYLFGFLITAAVFVVLPLTQFIGIKKSEKVELRKFKTIQQDTPDPPPPTPPPPPPPPEQQDTPPPPAPTASSSFDIPPPPMSFVGGGGGGMMLDNRVFEKAAESATSTIFSLAELDNRPVPTSQVAPAHPRALLKAKVDGLVVLLFVVREDGRIDEPRVESSSHPDFEKPALDAVKKWKFKPGQKDGKPVATYIRQPIRFTISS
jgi:protein TonB